MYTNATIRVELELPNGGVRSVEYEVGQPGARPGMELFEQLKTIAWKASAYAERSNLPAWHPAIILQDNDERSRLASYFQPDEGGEA